MTFTYNGLIKTIQQEKAGIIHNHIPMLSMHYVDFAEKAGLNEQQYPNLASYIDKASYQEKREVFESHGFSVLYLTLYGVKIAQYTTGNTNRAPKNPTIHDSFLNHQRNVFFIEINDGLKYLYFVVEYPCDDPLAAYTVDQEKLQKDKTLETVAKNFMDRVRQKHQ